MQSMKSYMVGGLGAAFLMILGSLLTNNLAIAGAAISTAPARHYYLSQALIDGAHALHQCASGYHFASFAEISDPSNLTYNKSLGQTAADAGSGPPSNAGGWIRSGNSSSGQPSNGAFADSNCSLWTDNTNQNQGAGARFIPSNGTFSPPLVIGNNSCAVTAGVWCVQN